MTKENLAIVMRNPGYWVIDLTNNVLLYTCGIFERCPHLSGNLIFWDHFRRRDLWQHVQSNFRQRFGNALDTQEGPRLPIATPANGDTLSNGRGDK